MKRLLLALLLMSPLAAAADRSILCGGSEAFIVEPDATAKVWSWKASDHAGVLGDLKAAFATTDDCKPVDGGKRILVSSSSGGCALLERETGRPLWWAKVRNAHSIEALPGGRIVVASSVGGDKLLFDRDKSAIRPHPDFKDRPGVKCVSIHSLTGRTLLIQSGGGHWWSDTCELFQPPGKLTLIGETLYKGRWLAEN